MRKAPTKARNGAEFRFRLVAAGMRGEALPITQGVDVAEHRRSRRQVLRLREVGIEDVVLSRRRIHRVVTALECSGIVGGVVETYERALVVEGGAAPVTRSVSLFIAKQLFAFLPSFLF